MTIKPGVGSGNFHTCNINNSFPNFPILLQSVNFSSPFYAAPHVITSASHVTDPLNILSTKPEHNAITEWVEVRRSIYFSVKILKTSIFPVSCQTNRA